MNNENKLIKVATVESEFDSTLPLNIDNLTNQALGMNSKLSRVSNHSSHCRHGSMLW